MSEAYRYGEPSLDSTMRRLARETAGPVIVVPLFPQRTEATTGTAFQRARKAAALAGIGHRLVERLIAPDDAGYVASLAVRRREALANATRLPEHLVVSFHGIPVRHNRREQGIYVRDCEVTTRAFLAAIEWPVERATLAYQSRFGPERWLTPATTTLLAELPGRGVKSVAVVTPGFLTDGLETAEEMGIRARNVSLGWRRGIHPRARRGKRTFVTSLCSLVVI